MHFFFGFLWYNNNLDLIGFLLCLCAIVRAVLNTGLDLCGLAGGDVIGSILSD